MKGINSEKYSTGVVYYTNSRLNGKINQADGLCGYRITNLCGIGNRGFALTDLDTYDIETAEKIGILTPKMIHSGVEHYVALTNRGDIYTWGIGDYGELGQGPKYCDIEIPTLIKHTTKFTSISCGLHHTCALDNKGNMFTWGQNFDRQLGLYKKKQTDLPSHCVVEDLLMSPKFVPMSLSLPIRAVSCGSYFTIVVTMVGEVWSWGAGECGQLGTGVCTFRDQPARCITEAITTESFKDVACGGAHVLALSEEGNLYVWGLNAKGQLGLGNIKQRATPTLMELPNGHEIAKIYASEHSSACITMSGQNLFTWGSGKDYRLMHGNEETYFIPTLVERFKEIHVALFCFAQKQSLALAHTRLTRIFPPCGPQKSFSSLELYGCGFWDSDAIVVRFTKRGDELALPRSSHGQYIRSDLIVCRPPKLSDIGLYDVTIAVNGIDFCSDVHVVDIYQDPILHGLVSPQIYNVKMESGRATLVLSCSRLGVQAKEYGVSVKLYDDDDPDREPILAKGVVETTLVTAFDETGRYDEDDEEMVGQSSLENMHPPSIEIGEEEQTVVCHDVDLTPLLTSRNPSSCVRLRAHISSNNHDYSEPSPERLICHWFAPTKISPACSPFAGQREVCVTGTGLLPTAQVAIEAIHTLRLPNTNTSTTTNTEESNELVLEVAVPVRSECWEELTYTVPSLREFFLHESRSPPDVDVIDVEISFRTVSGDVLTSSPFHFSYYSSKPIDVSPKWIRKSGGTVVTVTGPGVLFYSEAARIVMVDTIRTSANAIVKYDSFSKILDENNEETNNWKLIFTSPSFLDDPQSPRDDQGGSDVDGETGTAFVGLLLDGISQPQDSELTRVTIFTAITMNQSSFPPKGPVVIGTNVMITATGLLNTGICKLKIRSTGPEGRIVETTGSVESDCRGFSFVVPQSLLTLFPEGVGPKHVESFYLEISIDGSTFDSTTEPYLQVKGA